MPMGGYEVPNELLEVLNCEEGDESEEIRTNPIFINWVEKNRNKTDFAIVNVSDEATDYEINEYDGWESVICVINGKIKYLKVED